MIDSDIAQASTAPPVVTLQVVGLTVNFGHRTLFKDISFTLLDREILFVRGSSGTGVVSLTAWLRGIHGHEFTRTVCLHKLTAMNTIQENPAYFAL
jgi:ABC-type transport system involved in cytochrome c biogenesis ATPase subunit